MKWKKVVAGLVIILFAVALLLDKMMILPDISMIKIAISAVLVFIIGCALRKLVFIGITFPLGLIACLFSSELGIDHVNPVIIIIVSILIGIGLTLIFGRPFSRICCSRSGEKSDKHFGSASRVEYSEAEGTFKVDNNFGEKTDYVYVKNLKKGRIDNAMGNYMVYLNGTTIDPSGALIEIDNGLGSLKVYIPKELRVSVKTKNGLGTIHTHGSCSKDETLPLLTLKVENGLGATDLFFE